MLAKYTKTKYRYKHGNNPPNGKNKVALLQDWILVKENPGVEYEMTICIVEQNAEFQRLKEEYIEMKHTELRKQAKMIIAEVNSVIPHLTDTQIEEIKGALPDDQAATPEVIGQME